MSVLFLTYIKEYFKDDFYTGFYASLINEGQ